MSLRTFIVIVSIAAIVTATTITSIIWMNVIAYGYRAIEARAIEQGLAEYHPQSGILFWSIGDESCRIAIYGEKEEHSR